LSVCLLGKNAAKGINLFLDSVSQKVCNIKMIFYLVHD
jgi:hypothetical protein